MEFEDVLEICDVHYEQMHQSVPLYESLLQVMKVFTLIICAGIILQEDLCEQGCGSCV